MGWFLYDIGLRHERVKANNGNSRTIFEICESVLVLETIETLEKGVKYVQS